MPVVFTVFCTSSQRLLKVNKSVTIKRGMITLWYSLIKNTHSHFKVNMFCCKQQNPSGGGGSRVLFILPIQPELQRQFRACASKDSSSFFLSCCHLSKLASSLFLIHVVTPGSVCTSRPLVLRKKWSLHKKREPPPEVIGRTAECIP